MFVDIDVPDTLIVQEPQYHRLRRTTFHLLTSSSLYHPSPPSTNISLSIISKSRPYCNGMFRPSAKSAVPNIPKVGFSPPIRSRNNDTKASLRTVGSSRVCRGSMESRTTRGRTEARDVTSRTRLRREDRKGSSSDEEEEREKEESYAKIR